MQSLTKYEAKIQCDPTINFDDIPEIKRMDLAAATLKAVKSFMAQPGGREYLDKKIAERKARGL